jgi:hypothetical protein
MMDMRGFKVFHGLPASKGNRAAMNAVIRKMPGGDAVLTVIERLIKMQHGRGAKPDPVLQGMLEKLIAGREQMAEALIAGFRASTTPPPAAKKIGPPLMEDRIDWDTADWTKSDAELARIYGITRQSVRAKRLRTQTGKQKG